MSWPAALALGLGLGLGSFAWAQGEPASPQPTSEPASQPEPSAEPEAQVDAHTEPSIEAPPTAEPAEVPESERVLDRVLPCGTRVLVARDDSLPVASVVLTLERGSEDDPPELSGLHHALAYHLLQGNRDMPPGGITAMIQDGGGVAFLATGPGQIRFESLVPVSLLDDVIAAEASRFRAPTVTETLWKDTLATARRDVPHRTSAPRKAIAAAHGAAGLALDGRAVSKELTELDPPTIAKTLASTARYELATLVVVAPHPLEDTMETIEAAMADLPQQARLARERVAQRSVPSVELEKSKGRAFVWAIEGAPGPRLWAAAWCEALNRQRRSKDEAKTSRLRCVFDDDPRRPVITLRARTPDDPAALVEQRVAALDKRVGKRLIRAQLARLRSEVDTRRARPLDLARMLAASADTGTPATDVRELIGRATLDDSPAPSPGDILRVETAVRVLGPGGTVSPRRQAAAGQPPASEEGATAPSEAPQGEPAQAPTQEAEQ